MTTTKSAIPTIVALRPDTIAPGAKRAAQPAEKRRAGGSKPRLLYAESDLLMRALRDFWTSDIDEIVIDNDNALLRAGRFMRIVSPRSSTRLLHYDRRTPMFHAFGIEEQIARIRLAAGRTESETEVGPSAS